ncbi:MAG: nucleoside phosphorylase, partial [Acutalibacteraceae bacterium]
PTAALRDEGVSYHYLPPQRTVELNPKAVKSITKALDNLNINYRLCKTWTTDGFYRETAEMVDYRRNEGCDAVEMECAGLAACAQFRGAVFGQILYTADSLADTNEWDERYFGANSMKTALNLALESVVNIT